jgi:hypothetical protein
LQAFRIIGNVRHNPRSGCDGRETGGHPSGGRKIFVIQDQGVGIRTTIVVRICDCGIIAFLIRMGHMKANNTRHASDKASALNCAPRRVFLFDGQESSYETI